MSVRALAFAEFLRFLRRREGVILPLGLAIFGALPLVVVASAAPENVAGWRLDSMWLIDRLRCLLTVVEIGILALLAHVLAATSLALEHRRGSWSLLIESAATPGHLLAGKGLGVLACVTTAHLGFLLSIMATTPLVSRDVTSVMFEALAPLLAAAAAIPGGLAEAQVRRLGKGYGAFRSLNAFQWLSPLLVLAALLVPLGLERATLALRELVTGLGGAPLLVTLRETLPSHGLFLLVALAAQALLASLTWRLFVVSPRYA